MDRLWVFLAKNHILYRLSSGERMYGTLWVCICAFFQRFFFFVFKLKHVQPIIGMPVQSKPLCDIIWLKIARLTKASMLTHSIFETRKKLWKYKREIDIYRRKKGSWIEALILSVWNKGNSIGKNYAKVNGWLCHWFFYTLRLHRCDHQNTFKINKISN